jgi:endonuclease/exonuclease/phosphatase (EEP) superfamily protein YafD
MKKRNFLKPVKNSRMKPLKNFLWFVLQALNAMALIVLLAAAFSDCISPLRFAFFSYLGLFFPFILVGNLMVLLVWLIFKQWKMVLLNLLVILACSVSIHTYFPLHRKTKEIPENAIKILTYNVMRFEWIKRTKSNQSNKILQYIQECDADIVCIQEYGATKNKSDQYLSQADILKAMKKYPYHYIHPLDFPFNKSQIYGLAIFSKFPIMSSKEIVYDSEINGSFQTELDIHGKKVTLINNHL